MGKKSRRNHRTKKHGKQAKKTQREEEPHLVPEQAYETPLMCFYRTISIITGSPPTALNIKEWKEWRAKAPQAFNEWYNEWKILAPKDFVGVFDFLAKKFPL